MIESLVNKIRRVLAMSYESTRDVVESRFRKFEELGPKIRSENTGLSLGNVLCQSQLTFHSK